MQRLRTNETLLMFIFGAYLLIAPSVVTSYRIDDNLVKHFRNVVQLSDITASVTDDDTKSLITYQPINHSKAISDEEGKDWRLFEITVTGFGVDSIFLISTQHEVSCQENSSLPAWKIDKRGSDEGKFRLKINHATRLAGKTLYLCVRNESSQQFQHLGSKSRFYIDSG